MEPHTTQNLERKPSKISRPLPPPPTAGASPTTPPTRLSFAERKHRYRNRLPSLEPVIESDTRLLREIPDPPPAHTLDSRRLSKVDLSRRRSQYFEDAFQGRDVNPVKERVRGESMVLAEVKTNVIVNDEFTFITEISRHLSERYNRPLSSIIVTLHHRMCLFFGGSFAPAYCISISALPCQIQTATNKRNLLLLQAHLEKTLKVAPTRGVVRYMPVAEECFGWNGRTIAGEMAEVEGGANPESEGGQMRRRRTLGSLSMRRSNSTATTSGAQAKDRNNMEKESESVHGTADAVSPQAQAKPETEKKLRTKKSFIHTFFQRPSKPVSEPTIDEESRSSGDQ